jgi:hypothetical protein
MCTAADDLSTHMSRAAPLRGQLSAAAHDRISQFLASFDTFEPTLGLLYGDLAGVVAGRPSWSITALAPATVADLVTMYAAFGALVCFELDGQRVIVPQLAHVAELDGGMLEFVGNRLCVVSTPTEVRP